MRRVVLLLLLLLSTPAYAQEKGDPTLLSTNAERRGGLILGLAAGLGVGGASGYPNNATKIDDPALYAASGAMPGRTTTFLLMGAIADYLDVGPYLQMGSFASDDWKTSTFTMGLRVDAFPLYRLYPRLRDLGLYTQLGFGIASLEPRRGFYEGAEGAQSYLGGGVFYEFSAARFLGGHLALGPQLDYGAVVSRSLNHHATTLGVRFAFYGGK
jgi:hypothetical protein